MARKTDVAVGDHFIVRPQIEKGVDGEDYHVIELSVGGRGWVGTDRLIVDPATEWEVEVTEIYEKYVLARILKGEDTVVQGMFVKRPYRSKVTGKTNPSRQDAPFPDLQRQYGVFRSKSGSPEVFLYFKGLTEKLQTA